MTALNLYRRHGSRCPGGRELHDMTYEADELRRTWKKCACPIYASGTLAGKFRRKNTERTSWDEAKARASDWQTTQNWDGVAVSGPAPAPVPAEALPTTAARIRIDDAVTAYISLREASRMASATLRKYRTFAKQLTGFAESRGYVMLDQFTAADIDFFYAKMELGVRTKGKRLGTIRSFFRFCATREWLTKSPVSADLKPPLGANRVTNKVPFTDDELAEIIKACDRLPPTTWTNGRLNGTWTGEDAKDFIWVLVYTGLRISDVALFNVNRLRGNEIFLRAKKNGGDVFMWVPDWLRDRLQQRAKLHGVRPFLLGSSERVETVTDGWRRRINRVFELAGRFEEPPTPHRFRHTFARILLQRGVPVADVADLLGDDEETVRKHYARWVPERQARLTNILQGAFTDQPRP